MMTTFTVLDVGLGCRRQVLYLRDHDGGCYVARAAAEAPPIGAHLSGNKPVLGFNLLVGAHTGQVFRMIFEVIQCGQDEALGKLHSAPVTGPAMFLEASQEAA